VSKTDKTITPRQDVAIKVASALVHAQEFIGADGHPFDRHAFEALMNDPDVVAWMRRLNGMALLPRKRSNDQNYG
jgi:hypothetical protein